MPSNVFTVFNHGTDFHRDKDPNELITMLSGAMLGNEARIVQTGERTAETPLPFQLESPHPSYIICEGPGSDEVSAEVSQSGVSHAHPGKYNPIFNSEKNSGKSHQSNTRLIPTGGKKYWIMGEQQSSEFQDDFMGNTPQPYQATGRTLGNGWDDNVYKLVWLITHLKWETEQPIDTINIVGWSRGAVTCLKMANKLFEVFEDTINVNILAVDPVPGGLTPETVDTRIIPPNVQNYLAILAMDDNRSNFQPLNRNKVKLLAPQSQHGKNGNPDSLNPQHIKPQVHFLPMPGNHSDLVNRALSSAQVSHSAQLCRTIAWQYLTAHGTDFSTSFHATADEICQHYNELSINLKPIAKAASGGLISLVGGYRKERKVRAHRERYVNESDTYINEHHRLCALKQTYPDCNNNNATFSDDSWGAWGESKVFSLPESQACLVKMGIKTDN